MTDRIDRARQKLQKDTGVDLSRGIVESLEASLRENLRDKLQDPADASRISLRAAEVANDAAAAVRVVDRLWGYWEALRAFGIYHDGDQHIGVMQTEIHEAMRKHCDSIGVDVFEFFDLIQYRLVDRRRAQLLGSEHREETIARGPFDRTDFPEEAQPVFDFFDEDEMVDLLQWTRKIDDPARVRSLVHKSHNGVIEGEGTQEILHLLRRWRNGAPKGVGLVEPIAALVL